MTKKRPSEIKFLADENQEIFREKVKLRKFSTESENLSKIGENLKQGGEMHHGLRGGMDAPACSHLSRVLRRRHRHRVLLLFLLLLLLLPPSFHPFPSFPLLPVVESCTTRAHFIVTSLIFGANKSFVQ